ncbi:hypothetical protein D3C77_694480 [compost metagenome]
MRNNVVKKIPKDFGNAFVELTYQETTDETYAEVKREIAEHANGDFIDIEPEPTSGSKNETQPDEPVVPGESEGQPPNQGEMDFEINPDDIPPHGAEGPDF